MTIAADIHLSSEFVARAAIERVDRKRHLFTSFTTSAARLGVMAFIIVTLKDVVPDRFFLVSTVVAVLAFSAWLSVFARKAWVDQTRTRSRAYTYHVELDESGVRWRSNLDRCVRWDEYLRCAELPDALKIWHADGGISFIPRTPETEAVIAFTKTKIRSDVAHPAGVEPAT